MRVTLFLMLFLPAGIGGCAELQVDGPGSARKPPATHQRDARSNSLRGSVVFQGAPPIIEPIDIRNSNECVEANGKNAALPNESVQIGPTGGLKNVLVYVHRVDGLRLEPPAPAVVRIVGCRYEPHVIGVLQGQAIRFEREDETLHNPHSLDPAVGPAYGFGQPNSQLHPLLTDDERDVPRYYYVKCDVHPWMRMLVGVLQNPFFAVTDEDGRFDIGGLPAGEYKLVALHERFGEQQQTVTLSDGAPALVGFDYPAKDANQQGRRHPQ